MLGEIRPSPTRGSEGRVKKPSVRTADVPSLISSVETPAQVIVNALPGVAAGTAKRSA